VAAEVVEIDPLIRGGAEIEPWRASAWLERLGRTGGATRLRMTRLPAAAIALLTPWAVTVSAAFVGA